MRQKVSIRALIKFGDKVLLVRRAAGRASILGKYELPGGSLEFHEQPQNALIHLIDKYLGATIETAQLFDVISFIDPDDTQMQYVFILYQVALVNNSNLKLTGRYDKYSWVLPAEIQPNFLTNSANVLLGLTAPEQAPISITQPIVDNSKLSSNSEGMTIYSDGGSRGNPGPSASAFVIMDQDKRIIADGGVYLGITTNNQAEYQAVYQALKKAIELGIKTVDFRMDSNLVVNQLNGVYKIKNRDLWPIYQQIKELLPFFDKISFSHVYREANQKADSLVNEILDKEAR